MQRPLHRHTFILALLSLAFALIGCDSDKDAAGSCTVHDDCPLGYECTASACVELSGKQTLTDLTALGLRYNACAAATPNTSCLPPGCAQLDFVMETNLNQFVTPGIELEGMSGRLTPGKNFGAQPTDIQFTKLWLFQLDAKGLDKTCTAATDCASGFECRTLTDADLPGNDINIGRAVCAVPAEMVWKNELLTFFATGADPQTENSHTDGFGFDGLSLAILMDNSDSLIGRDPVPGSIDPTKATDPALDRFAALKSFRAELFDANRSTLTGRSEFALFDLSGFDVGDVVDVFLTDATFNRSFMTDTQINFIQNNRIVFEQAIDGLAATTGGTSPLWDGLLTAAQLFAQPDNVAPNYARHALLFADSPSDGSTASITEQELIAPFTTAKAHATIVHLDSMAPVNAVTAADPNDTEAIYIANTLRSGPLSSFNTLACTTGGYYTYDVWPKALLDHMRRLGRGFEGVWSIEIDTFAVLNQKPTPLAQLPPGWYRLAATMSVTLANSTEQFHFSAQKIRDVFQENAGGYTDSRLLFEVK